MKSLWKPSLKPLLLLAIFCMLLGSTNVMAKSKTKAKIWTDAKQQHEPYIDPRINSNMTSLVKNTLPAVVSIATEVVYKMGGRGRNAPMNDFFEYFFNQPFGKEFKQQGMGSGFLISAEGHILTNNHVVENADEITVQLQGGDEYQAKVIGKDARTDMALIKIDAGKKLPFLILGDSDKLHIGHTVVAMGNPFGLSQTVTKGIVSQKGRKDINPSGRKIIANFIQTDASINPGNSGGPLVNIYGEAVGINTAIAQGNGIGFAIPINMTKILLPQLTTGKIQRSWIGIQLQHMTPELADSLGLPSAKGALIASVVPDSPAAKAGLRPEDVIIKFDGKIVDSEADLAWLASMHGVGKKVRLKIWRNGRKKMISLKLGKMPGSQVAEADDNQLDTSDKVLSCGMELVNPDKRLLKKLEIKDGKGVLVVKVDPTSAAAKAGVRPGDVIRKVNTTLIKNSKHFERVVGKLPKGKTIRLFINRDKMALFIAFTLR